MNRASLLANIPVVLKYLAAQKPHEALGQGALFGEASFDQLKLIELPELPADQLLWNERKALGAFITGHPLDRYRHALGRVTHTCREYEDMTDSDTSCRMVVAGIIRAYRRLGRIAFITLDDGTGSIEIICFNDEADRYFHALQVDMVVALQLRPRHDNSRRSLQMLQAHRLGRFGPFA